MALENSVSVSATTEAVWRFLENLERNYVLWHPEDRNRHVRTEGANLKRLLEKREGEL